MKLSVNPEKADAQFVYYFFRMPSTVQSVINHALTSGVPHINLGILKDFDIPLPHTAVQERIVDILSAYDDLIENNRRRMALLEEAARQLYGNGSSTSAIPAMNTPASLTACWRGGREAHC